MRPCPKILSLTIAAALVLPATGLAGTGQPTIKISPAKVKSGGKVTVSGKNWGNGGDACQNKITLSAADASGQSTPLPTIHAAAGVLKPFSKRITVKLASGAYTVTANQACGSVTDEGEEDTTSTATAQLTVR